MPRASYARLQAASGNGNGGELPVSGNSAVAFQVSGTFVALINFEGSVDGVTFLPLVARPLGFGAASSVAQTPDIYVAPCGGLFEVRARVSDYVSGTVYVDALANEGMADLRSRGDPATRLSAVSKNDTADLTSQNIRALWIGTGGDVVITAVGDSTPQTIKNVPNGFLLPVSIRRLWTTTSASDIVGLS